MTVIAGYQLDGSSETHHVVTVKGAPEVLRKMVIIYQMYFDWQFYFSIKMFRPIMTRLINGWLSPARVFSPLEPTSLESLRINRYEKVDLISGNNFYLNYRIYNDLESREFFESDLVTCNTIILINLFIYKLNT